MKHLILIFIAFIVVACNNERQIFEPVKSSENLTDNQIDSILTKFNFKYENPILIDSTNQMVVPLSTDILDSRKKFSSDGYYSNDFPRYWNILFYNKETNENKLLTNKKTRISEIHLNRMKSESDKMKSFILYELSQTDYNGDGKLNYLDPEYLYSSDITGNNLKRISPKNEDIASFEVMPNKNQIIFRTIRDSQQDSVFNREDESILYKAALINEIWEITEVIDSNKRNEIEKLYFDQWLTKNK